MRPRGCPAIPDVSFKTGSVPVGSLTAAIIWIVLLCELSVGRTRSVTHLSPDMNRMLGITPRVATARFCLARPDSVEFRSQTHRPGGPMPARLALVLIVAFSA